MTGFDAGRTLADRFRVHAGQRTHVYGYAMRGMAEDWEAGGPVREVCAGYEEAPTGAVIQLRLLAGVFRLVLTGRAPQLVPFYPCLGGEEPPADAWPLMQTVIGAHIPELHGALAVAPQTNEVGRAAALLAGLFDVIAVTGHRYVRLLEVGASAGLNLLLDEFGFSGDDAAHRAGAWRWGAAHSPLQLPGAIQGPVQPQDFSISARRGCDLFPVDPTAPAGRLLLTSFVWPFDVHRHQRLTAALAVAAAHPVCVDQRSASDWLAQQLLAAEDPSELTVVWHSISQLYWPPEETERVDAQLADAGALQPLARITMEFSCDQTLHRPEVRTTLWRPASGPEPRVRLVGTAHDHGIPVRLASR